MWGRQGEASVTYKRVSSRDNTKVDMDESSALFQNGMGQEITNPSWKLSLPHIIVATISSFLFGYHLGVVNEPLETIALDLGFSGNTLAEGLVVSTCLGGAFIGSLFSGWIADGIGRRRAFQLCALPMIIGASVSATTKSLEGMLIGRFLVGTGMGVGPPVASLYVTEVSPAFVRGTYGCFIQLATCLGLMGALFIGIPVKAIIGWWRICFWIATVPAGILAFAMMFCAESPHWLFKKGRIAEAEAEFEKLLGGSHVKYAMADLHKSDRGDETDAVKLSELLYGRHFRGRYDTSLVCTYEFVSMFSSALRFTECCCCCRHFFIFSFCLQECFVFTDSFCSCFYWINPICFTTAIWYKRCFLFLFHCI
ncbi:hypothetical protein PVL29_014200 [Vitis rotundifolia]|uniref:Major facilitator superfamily (MFS) profile domain-containing protein n=1 Tax=Vitis rotundifolia TaxID=103349 RepID=A0AA38ZGU4_VITRO|nr:hypothetical protein PVL29_014200 [Vitis rotundifolia]